MTTMITVPGTHDVSTTETDDRWGWTCSCGGHSGTAFRHEYEALNDAATDNASHIKPATHVGGITSTSSRTIHVVPDATRADKGTTRTAACGQAVTVRWYEVGPATEVCLRCRKALGWPLVVTWESQGRTFTTDFSRKA